MYCKNCGNVIPDGVAFCGSCGAAVTPAAPAANVPPVTQQVPPAQPYAPPAGGYVPPVPPVNPAPGAGYTGAAIPAQVEDPGKKLGTISLVLGIVGLAVGSICSCLFACLGGVLPLAAAIVGIVLGKQAQDKSKAAGFENKNGKIGMILSIVAVALIVVFIIVNAIAGGVMASEFI